MNLDFSKGNGLLPCVAQDASTGRVLMLGFMNEEAYTKTLKEKRVTFFSRSKQRLWTKGETSGNYLLLDEMLVDCDKDTLLAKVTPQGPVCHTGADTCFNESNAGWNLGALERLIQTRKLQPVEGSYTNKLLHAGINKVAQKVGEESIELVIEAKDDNRELFLNEAADLMYHFLVLLAVKGLTLREVEEVLAARHKK